MHPQIAGLEVLIIKLLFYKRAVGVFLGVIVTTISLGFVPQLIAEEWSATIERDTWGVPHIKGARDTDAAFGLGYAQAEDTWSVMESSMPYYRASAGSYFGPDAAKSDYVVRWLGLWDDIDQRFNADVAPATRRYLEAFAAGINQFAADNPDRVTLDILPITAKDIVAAHMLRHVMFYGFDGVLKEITGENRARPLAKAPAVGSTPLTQTNNNLEAGTANSHGLPIGSNAIAVGPSRSGDGSTMLIINSHQPLTGPVAWYEAHIESDEGLNAMGGLFPGSPTISVGFTTTTSWGATVNKPDLVDVYVLTMHPEHDNQYLLDGEWQTLVEEEIELDVLLWGFIPWSVSETIYRSVHGPVMKTDHGVYAVRYAGMGEVRQVDQWLAMNKATDFASWKAAVKLNHIQSFNFVYAGRDRHIYFVHNSEMPVRARGWNWQDYLPGDRSDLIWDDYLPFDQLPQIMDPASGFILSTNQTPFAISAPGSNPSADDSPIESGWQTRMTNRAVRGLELFSQFERVDQATLLAIKHDNAYSANYRGMRFLNAVTAMPVTDPQLQAAQNVLKTWDRGTDLDNRGAALGVCVLRAEWLSESSGTALPNPQDTLVTCVKEVLDLAGELTPTWGQVNRHGRGDVHLPVAGGPDTLRAAYSSDIHEDHRHVVAGDGLYYLVRWDQAGNQNVLGVHQYGNHFDDLSHPHAQNQVQDFVDEVMHKPLFQSSERAGYIERRYTVTGSATVSR